MHTYVYPLNHLFSKNLPDVHINNRFKVNRNKSCSLPLSSSTLKGWKSIYVKTQVSKIL